MLYVCSFIVIFVSVTCSINLFTFGTYMMQCWMYIPTEKEDYASYIYNIAAIFVEWYTQIIWSEVCTMLVVMWLMQVIAWHVQMHLLYMSLKYMAYIWNVIGIFFLLHVWGMWNEADVVLGCIFPHVHHCQVYMPILYEGSMSCNCNVTAISFESYANNVK